MFSYIVTPKSTVSRESCGKRSFKEREAKSVGLARNEEKAKVMNEFKHGFIDSFKKEDEFWKPSEVKRDKVGRTSNFLETFGRMRYNL